MRKRKRYIDLRKVVENFKSRSDPMGSYTGNPLDGDKPVQDADDI